MADERDVFEALVRQYGRPRLGTRTLADYLTEDGDCWTHAWLTAQKRGGRYVEGMCYIGNCRVRAHAWAEVDGPFGTLIIECTEGYEEATWYYGITVDCASGGYVDHVTVEWDHERASVIEALFVAGLTPAEILQAIQPPHGS